MRVVVTGGAGFIGSHVVDALNNSGHEVLVVDSLVTGRAENVSARADSRRIDVRDGESVRKVFADFRPEVVNHHAAQTDVVRSMSDPLYDADVNVMGSLTVLQAAIECGARKMIFASTSAVYPDPEYLPVDEAHPTRPQSAYGLTKLAVENYLRLLTAPGGLSYTIFRYGNVFGPRQSGSEESGVISIFCRQLSTGVRPTIFGDGTKTRDYVYVEDIAAANVLALGPEGDGETFNLARGIEVSDFEIFSGVKRAFGAKADAVAPIFGTKRPGEVDRACLSAQKAERLLGWRPRVGLEEGIRRTARHFLDSIVRTS